MATAGAVLGLTVTVQVDDIATTGKTLAGLAGMWTRIAASRSCLATVPAPRRGRRSAVRPGRGSRPRSKQRPDHDDAVDGTVITVDRGPLHRAGDGVEVTTCGPRELGRHGIAVR